MHLRYKKSNGYFGKRRTLVLYECVYEVESRISVKGVLSELNASTLGYNDWKKRKPFKQTKRQERIKEQIVKIHEESYKIYGAPKITEVLRSKAYRIAQRTVSKYMNEEGIKVHYIKPYTTTTRDGDFASKLKNILNRDFTLNKPDTVLCSDITYIWTQTV